MNTYSIYTDGGCIGNPGPGGWAFVAYKTNAPAGTPQHIAQQSGYAPQTTNNRMELMAVISALQYCRETLPPGTDITITTDSQYVQKGITEWMPAWLRNNWRKKDKKPLKNIELWQRLHALSEERPNLTWKWVRGHSGHIQNELCHDLVQQAIAAKK